MTKITTRREEPSDNINWQYAQPVPLAVLQRKDGVAGVIIEGPMGQRTFKGSTNVSRQLPDDSWRRGLADTPDQ